jgi:hypothetical protein
MPCGASAVKPGSVKMAGTVSGFVCAGKVAGAMEKRRQRAKIRKQKQEGTKTTPQPESVLRVGNDESVYRSAAGIREARQASDPWNRGFSSKQLPVEHSSKKV